MTDLSELQAKTYLSEINRLKAETARLYEWLEHIKANGDIGYAVRALNGEPAPKV